MLTTINQSINQSSYLSLDDILNISFVLEVLKHVLICIFLSLQAFLCLLKLKQMVREEV